MNTLDILATLIAQLLLSKLGLSSLHLAAVVPLIAVGLTYIRDMDPTIIMNPMTNFYDSAKQLIPAMDYIIGNGINIIPFIACLVLAIPFLRRWYKNQYITVIIQSPDYYNIFVHYIQKNKDKFNMMPTFVSGDINLIAYSRTEMIGDDGQSLNDFIEPGQTIYFKNTVFGKGYFKSFVKQVECDMMLYGYEGKSNKDKPHKTNIDYPVYYCKLFIWRKSINMNHIRHIENLIRDDNYDNNRKNNYFNIENYKIYKSMKNTKKQKLVEITRHKLFNGFITNQFQFESIYMDSYFSQEKDRLWHLIKEIDQNKNYFRDYGQIPKLNLLLYGPPGTGKSTFAYRVAMSLMRDIVNLNITEYPSKYIVDKLMLGYIDNERLNGTPIHGSRLVYVFDEFDRTIDYLLAAEKKEKTIFESKIKAMAINPLSKLLSGSALSGKKQKPNYESDDEDSNSGLVAEDIESIPDIMTINDLLEIFQGVVDVEGRLIFAMTNHYEKIQAECPALFRPGRLTPVYFGYINLDTLRDIVWYYFKQEISQSDTARLPQSEFNIPTSEIIEQAMFNKASGEKGYTKFINWLIKRCDQPPPLIPIHQESNK